MEENSMELKVGGIKCDNCDFRDETVKWDDYLAWVNKPCPKCGENLLTEEDYQMTQVLHNAVDFLNTFSPEEMEELSNLLKPEDVFNSEPFADTKGKEHLNSGGLLDLTVDVHNGIRVTEIKPSKDQEVKECDASKS